MRSQVNSTLTQNYGGIDSFDPWSLLFNFLMVQVKRKFYKYSLKITKQSYPETITALKLLF